MARNCFRKGRSVRIYAPRRTTPEQIPATILVFLLCYIAAMRGGNVAFETCVRGGSLFLPIFGL